MRRRLRATALGRFPIVSVLALPVLDAGVQRNAPHGDLAGRQIVEAFLVPVDYNPQVTGVGLECSRSAR